MWVVESTAIDEDLIIKIRIHSGDHFLKISEVIEKWIEDTNFRIFYNSILTQAPFSAFFWEHPAFTSRELNTIYEFVLVKSDFLDIVKPNPHPFTNKFSQNQKVATFPNLGGDAILIVPSPANKNCDYAHLGKFSRLADKDEIDQFWISVGIACKEALNDNKIWLSTSGLGVYWVHARIDSRPKYYQYIPYKT